MSFRILARPLGYLHEKQFTGLGVRERTEEGGDVPLGAVPTFSVLGGCSMLAGTTVDMTVCPESWRWRFKDSGGEGCNVLGLELTLGWRRT